MNSQKIIGFVLLGIGVVIVLYALFASYGIFTGSKEPSEVFSEPVKEMGVSTSSGIQDVEQQIQGLLQKQLASLLPEDTISKTLNLFSWSIFAGILMFGGTQLAGIGVRLLNNSRKET